MNEATVIELGADASSLIVHIDASTPRAISPAIETRWLSLCTDNPRLFNGRILAFLDADLAAPSVRVCIDQYKRMAAQTAQAPEVIQFGVTGILTAPLAAGDPESEHAVLIGQRSNQTHVYPSQWELAPSGGVDAPPEGTSSLTVRDIAKQVEKELAEETGFDPTETSIEPIALCNDPVAPSMDVVFRIRLHEPPPQHTRTWEYDSLQWVRINDLAGHLRDRRIKLIPPSAAVTRWLGWQ